MFHVASKNSQSEAIKPTRRCLSQNLLHSLSIFVAVHDLFHMNVKLQKYIIPFAFVHIHIIYIYTERRKELEITIHQQWGCEIMHMFIYRYVVCDMCVCVWYVFDSMHMQSTYPPLL